MINFATLIRPALLKMLGYSNLVHPSVQAVADDSLPGKKPMAFVKWTDLRLENNQYQLRLNSAPDDGPLVSMARANSLTIVPEGSEIQVGGHVSVLPLNWNLDY